MKISRNTFLERKHINNLVIALMTLYNFQYTGMTISQNMLEEFGITADWHDCANALDDLATQGKINRAGTNANGNAIYTIE